MERIKRIENSLKKSKFRSRFKLDREDLAYIKKAGLFKIESHAEGFLTRRLAPANPRDDGRQTPFKGHPVFRAQHATATCCRSCLYKWYKIPKKRPLDNSEIAFVKERIMDWIKKEIEEKINIFHEIKLHP